MKGTIRSNLDPSGQYSNVELEDALRRVQLVQSSEAQDDCNVTKLAENEININIFEKLSSKISDGGLNLSQGQRQLLCLARAIISRPKIMVLDEATSAVDMETDILIQRFIREELRDSTLIVIAHRLSTIADFDKVLVLSEGKIDEFDSPRALLEKKGTFHSMVVESGEKELLERMIFGVIEDGNRSIGGEIPQTPSKGKARGTKS
jgi:ABC-type multidrug transport system fused ATPase/permease subunit